MAQPLNRRSYLQVYSPAALPLAVVKMAGGGRSGLAVLGAALQHPPVDLAIYRSHAAAATGPRADVAAAHLQRLYKAWPNTPPVDVEIESAIPSALGLGSESMLGLSVAKGLARLNGASENVIELAQLLGFDSRHALDVHCAGDGGLVLVDATDENGVISVSLQQAAIAHSDDRAWGFVIVQPRAQGAILDEGDAVRLQRVIAACQMLDDASGQLVREVLFPAVKADDLSAFGEGLTALLQMNRTAVEQADLSMEHPPNTQAILDVMRQNGAVACGQSLSGLALYALTRGARATINMRAALRSVMSHSAGYMFATIVDNRGMRLVEKER